MAIDTQGGQLTRPFFLNLLADTAAPVPGGALRAGLGFWLTRANDPGPDRGMRARSPARTP